MEINEYLVTGAAQFTTQFTRFTQFTMQFTRVSTQFTAQFTRDKRSITDAQGAL
jgi:hypothetical protein